MKKERYLLDYQEDSREVVSNDYTKTTIKAVFKMEVCIYS
jgi:hypothetical protein